MTRHSNAANVGATVMLSAAITVAGAKAVAAHEGGDDAPRAEHRQREHGLSRNARIVVDASGKTVASMVAMGPYGAALIRFRGQRLLVALAPHIRRENFTPLSSGLDWGHGSLFFANADCTGSAYVGFPPFVGTTGNGGEGGQRAVAAVQQGDQWIAYVGADALPQRVSVGSTLAAVGAVGQCDRVHDPLPAVPAEASFPLNSFGVAPFYVE